MQRASFLSPLEVIRERIEKQRLAGMADGTCFYTSCSGARIWVGQGNAVAKSISSKIVVRFGPFEADFRAGELRKHGVKLKLVGQPFEVLVVLLERPGQLVTREELRARLWPTDRFVDFDHSLNAAVNKLRDALSDSAEKPNYVETLPRRGYRFISAVGLHDSQNLLGKPSSPKIQSLVVLPLENLSKNPDEEYFADGMTDQLITNLTQISALKVISRTSAMRYKGTKKSLPEIAQELDVDAVVEGTVMWAGGRVRISAQLIEAPTDHHLWAASYERDLRDVLSMQEEVTRAIVSEIRVKLTAQEQERLANSHPINPESYQLYLKGRYHWNKRTVEGFQKPLNTSSRLPPKTRLTRWLTWVWPTPTPIFRFSTWFLRGKLCRKRRPRPRGRSRLTTAWVKPTSPWDMSATCTIGIGRPQESILSKLSP